MTLPLRAARSIHLAETMSTQVEASTVSAGSFLSNNRLVVPDYQRRYSWSVDTQVAEFWRDLSYALNAPEYFLGLIVVTNPTDNATSPSARIEIVDGQQRLVTLVLLANALRLAAMRLGRRLVAESLRTDFLYSIDFATEEQLARVVLTDVVDQQSLSALLVADSAESIELNMASAVHKAHTALHDLLMSDLEKHDNAAIRVGQWTEFISKRLKFAVFMHPDRAAAFRVYEVINTRGKSLTPSELIKSFLIGSSDQVDRDQTHARWHQIEDQLELVGGFDELTTFVRHVVSLDHGYVIPRDLYGVVSKRYPEASGVRDLLTKLENYLPVYLQMLDPSSDVESSETRTRTFTIIKALAMSRLRPLLLVASQFSSSEADRLYEEIMSFALPAALVGALSTGSAEAQIARSSRRLSRGESDWQSELRRLADLRPPRDEFLVRLRRSLNRPQAHVARSAFLQQASIPELSGYPHQVRPRNGEGWRNFDDDAYSEIGGRIGNWVLTSIERRPQGARTPDAVSDRILPLLMPGETLTRESVLSWSADGVEARSDGVIGSLAELWYGS